ncbi:hypothetical protein QYF36_023114 [Acer negundo]|nr:hypothetical protein QYF36_023114 [Acer negundo]
MFNIQTIVGLKETLEENVPKDASAVSLPYGYGDIRELPERVSKIEFTQLRTLKLQCLPQLTSFGSKEFTPDTGSQEILAEDELGSFISSFSQNVLLPRLEDLKLSSINIEWIINIEELRGEGRVIKMVFPELINLQLKGLPNLTQFASGNSVEFPSLTQLSIQDCPKLKTFSTAVMFADIKQSEEAEEMNCQDDIHPLFDQKLDLKHLLELTSFCSFAGNSIELPSLAQLWLENCPKMHTFVSNSSLASKEETVNSAEENLQSQVQTLFDEKVQIPNVKSLRIDKMDNMRKIWHHQLTPDSFSKIDSVGVYDCHNLFNIFPSNMIGKLQKLKELRVLNCKSVEVIFEELDISSCMVEEIVADQENIKAVPKLVYFPELTFLRLSDLPRLRILYPGLYISRLPMLKTMRIWRCKKVEKLTSEFQRLQENHGETQHQNFSIQQPLFTVDKVAFPNLEDLSLEWNCIAKESMNENFSGNSCKLKDLRLIDASKEAALCPCFFLYKLPNLEKLHVIYGVLEEMFICKGHGCKEKYMAEVPSKLNYLSLVRLNDSLNLGEENSLLCKIFQNLTTLEVLSCNELKALVSSTVTFQNLTTLEVSKSGGLINLMAISTAKSLVQLARLKIIECKMIEEIVIHGGDREENPIIFSRLEYLELHCLPRLTSFYTGSHAIEFPSLQQIVVRQCPNMKCFTQGALSTPGLHKLQTKEAEEGFWEGSLNTTIQKLFKDMDGFRGIENFTVSDFPQLKEAWHKQLLDCYFSNLKSLVVDDKCSSLTYVFTPSVALDLVKLEELEIKNCAVLEVIMVIEEGTKVNTLFPNLHTLKLRDLPKLSSFCNFAGNAIELPSLATLRILNCPNMQSFISNSIGADMSTSKDNLHTDIPLFDEKVQLPNLNFLLLEEMDNLRKIWHHQLNSDSFCKIATFGNLIYIEVLRCDNLKSIFPASIARSLPQLEQLWIEKCCTVEEIFAKGEEVDDAVPGFPQLTFLRLAKLSKLRSFYQRGHISEWPMLKKLQVWNCDKVEISASNILRFQVTDGESQHEMPISQPLLLFDKVPFSTLESLGLDWKWFEKEALHEKLPETSIHRELPEL